MGCRVAVAMIMLEQEKTGSTVVFRQIVEGFLERFQESLKTSDAKPAVLLTRGMQRVGILFPVDQGYRFEAEAAGANELDGCEFPSCDQAIALIDKVAPSTTPLRLTYLADMG